LLLLFISFTLQKVLGRSQFTVLQGKLIIKCFANEAQLITFWNHQSGFNLWDNHFRLTMEDDLNKILRESWWKWQIEIALN